MSQLQDASKHNKRSAGFTLVEALVALTLLTVGLIPAFQQATAAINLSNSIRNSLIAAHIAQEGIEVVRGMRDANWFNRRPFDDSLTVCASGCTVQFDSDAPQPTSFAESPLRLDPLSGLYQYNTGNPTPFSRIVIITQEAPHKLYVVSEVAWQERSTAKKFSVEYYLFDWMQ